MLLFHGIGTGKTYTSITIAETIKSINPNMKILVILPARLKTNFMDELKGINNYEILSYESLRNKLIIAKNYKKEIIKLTKNNVIELPDYWEKLADEKSISVQLTPIGSYQELFI